MKKRVFVSFDFGNDKALNDFVIGQSKLDNSPFEVVDCSMKEAAPQDNWTTIAEKKIKSADIVSVIVGSNTYKTPSVLKEVKKARDNGIKIVQIIGYKDKNYTAVPSAGHLYAWNWDNLKKLLS